MDGTRSKLIDQSCSLLNHTDQIHSRNTSVGIRFWIQLFNIFPFNLDSFHPWYGCKRLVPTLRGKLATLTPCALNASQNGDSDAAWVETTRHHSGPICSYSRSAHLNKTSHKPKFMLRLGERKKWLLKNLLFFFLVLFPLLCSWKELAKIKSFCIKIIKNKKKGGGGGGSKLVFYTQCSYIRVMS